jgi:hypothetical protein
VRLTLYCVGLVQVTDAGDPAADGLPPKAATGVEAWQAEEIVAVTANEEVKVAARAGFEARPNTERPNAIARVENLMGICLSSYL